MEETQNGLERIRIIVNALEEKKGEDISVLEIGKVSVIADYFVIVSGAHEKQTRALMDAVEEAMGKAGIEPKRIEGYNSANWILADYGDIVIHIFDRKSREFYNLEHIWMDADRVSIPRSE